LTATEVKGTVIPFISAKAVEDFPVPAMSQSEIEQEESKFTKQLSLTNDIERIKGEIAQLSLDSLPDSWK
jgi:hypothetical protein